MSLYDDHPLPWWAERGDVLDSSGRIVAAYLSEPAAKLLAKLLAGTPDLLTVARTIEDWMRCDEPKGGGQFIGALASAIAKAEGRDAE